MSKTLRVAKPMKTNRANKRIAVNTMRSRLTILGFSLAIITFQLTHLSNQRAATVAPGFDALLHLSATVTLYFALLLSVAAMVLLIGSGGLSEDGACAPRCSSPGICSCILACLIKSPTFSSP
jgi:hypothetical protein